MASNRAAIARPSAVVAVDANGKPTTITAPRVDVTGYQRQLPGNGLPPGNPARFDFGFEKPASVVAYLADGRRVAKSGLLRILFVGGQPIDPSTPAPSSPKLPPAKAAAVVDQLSRLVANHEPTHTSEIVDAKDDEVHLVDNGASLEMADRVDGGITDFDLQVKARNEALQATGGDDLAAHVLLQDSHVQSVQAQAPTVSTNPPSAITSLLGGQATLTPPPRGAGPALVEVARWNGADNEAQNVTVTLGPAQIVDTIIGGVGVDLQSRPFARVQWGTRGFALSADIDIGLGQQFSIGASYVSLSVGMEALLPVTFGTPQGLAQKLTGMLSFGQVERGPLALTRTVGIKNAAGQTSIIYDCPPFAKSIIAVYTFDNIYISPRDISGGQLGTTQVFGGAVSSAVTTTIVLPGGTVDIQIDAVAGTFASSPTLVFALGL